MGIIETLTGSSDKPKQDIMAPSKMPETNGKSVIILTGDKCEDQEFFYPLYRLVEEGYQVDVVTPKGGKLTAKHGSELQATLALKDVSPSGYDLLYLPGGQAPASLRKDEAVLRFVKEFAASGKPIAAICHGPQILVSAGLVPGKRLSSWPEVGKEIEEAGGSFKNAALVEDGQFITARWPGDLPVHLKAVIKRLKAGGVGAANTNAQMKKPA